MTTGKEEELAYEVIDKLVEQGDIEKHIAYILKALISTTIENIKNQT